MFEEPCIVVNCLFCQRFDAGARSERAGRFVKGDMPVRADAKNLQIDAATLDDAVLIPLAKCFVIVGRPGRNVNILGWDGLNFYNVLSIYSLVILY